VSRPRVLYVTKYTGGGAAISLYKLLKELDRDSYEPVVLCLRLDADQRPCSKPQGQVGRKRRLSAADTRPGSSASVVLSSSENRLCVQQV
jgi:hypothetical protein